MNLLTNGSVTTLFWQTPNIKTDYYQISVENETTNSTYKTNDSVKYFEFKNLKYKTTYLKYSFYFIFITLNLKAKYVYLKVFIFNANYIYFKKYNV